MAERYNTRQFSYTAPIMYQGEEYPSTQMSIADDKGNIHDRNVFTDSKGRYYTINDNGVVTPIIMQHELPEVVVTAPRENMLSKQFNDYLVMQNNATNVSKPVVSEEIKPDLSFDAVLRRTAKTYSNYSEALDTPFSDSKETLTNSLRYVKDHYIEDLPTGASNCTLSATQWVNPANPVKSASSIVSDPAKYNYARIDSIDALPGDLLIAKVPNNDIYHTMLITGFAQKDKDYNFRDKKYKAKEGEPLLTYSKGGNSLDNLQYDVPLSVYTDHSDGHTENMFFRYIKPNNNSLLKLR